MNSTIQIVKFQPLNDNCYELCEFKFNKEIRDVIGRYPCFSITEPITDDILCDIFCSSEHSRDLTVSMEMLVRPADESQLVEKVSMKMSSLRNDNNLLIIDPYFFDNKPETIELLVNIFKMSGLNIKNLYIVSKSNNIIKFQEELNIEFPEINLVTYKSDLFHDRFWIGLDTKKGIVMGTSLNGLAKRICLIENICNNDVNDILKEYNAIVDKANSKSPKD